MDLLALATQHAGTIVRDAIRHPADAPALLVFDLQSPLSRVLTDAYKAVLPRARVLDFDQAGVDATKDALNACVPGELVVLVQSANFRLNEFRIRVELFARGLKVVEHGHLNRIPPTQEATYVASLGFHPERDGAVGRRLKERLDRCASARVVCHGAELRYDGAMEPAKMNTGNYEGLKNVGGGFPIGEVFTEPADLTRVNGAVLVYGYAPDDHIVRIVEPFRLEVKDGLVTDWSAAPADFAKVMELVSGHERPLVREFGLGLNPAMDRHRVVDDITAYERMTGVHLSIGAKHPIYAKPGLSRKDGRYHIDVFVDTDRVFIDEDVVFQDGRFTV